MSHTLTDILAAHDGWGFNGWDGDQMQHLCDCGYLFIGGKQEHAEHVAVVVALHFSAAGLT